MLGFQEPLFVINTKPHLRPLHGPTPRVLCSFLSVLEPILFQKMGELCRFFSHSESNIIFHHKPGLLFPSHHLGYWHCHPFQSLRLKTSVNFNSYLPFYAKSYLYNLCNISHSPPRSPSLLSSHKAWLFHFAKAVTLPQAFLLKHFSIQEM